MTGPRALTREEEEAFLADTYDRDTDYFVEEEPMEDLLLFVVTSTDSSALVDVFQSEDAAIAQIREWFPEAEMEGSEFYLPGQKTPCASYCMRRLPDPFAD